MPKRIRWTYELYEAKITECKGLLDNAEKDLAKAKAKAEKNDKAPSDEDEVILARSQVEQCKILLNNRKDNQMKLKRKSVASMRDEADGEAVVAEAAAVITLPVAAVKHQKHSAHDEKGKWGIQQYDAKITECKELLDEAEKDLAKAEKNETSKDEVTLAKAQVGRFKKLLENRKCNLTRLKRNVKEVDIYMPINYEEKIQRYEAKIEDLKKLKVEAEKDLVKAETNGATEVDVTNAKVRVEEFKKQLNHKRDYRTKLKRKAEAAAVVAGAVAHLATDVKRQKHSTNEEKIKEDDAKIDNDNQMKLKRQVEAAGDPEVAAATLPEAHSKRQAIRVLVFSKHNSNSSGGNNRIEVKQVLLVPSDIGDDKTVHDAMVVAQQRKEFLFMDDGSGDIEFNYNYNGADLPLHYRTDSKEIILRDLFSLTEVGKPLELWYTYNTVLEETTVLDLSVGVFKGGSASIVV